jgi:hypothetical protein
MTAIHSSLREFMGESFVPRKSVNREDRLAIAFGGGQLYVVGQVEFIIEMW